MNIKRSQQDTFLENKFLLENIQGGIVYSDFEPPFHLRYATEGMAKLSGYTIEELCSMEQMDLVHTDDITPLVSEVQRQFAMGDTFEVEYRLKRKDGSYVHVLDRAKVVVHKDGKKYIHCLLTDVSDLKKMQKALRLNQEKYRLAIQQSGKAILEYDINTKKLNFSDNYQQLFGCLAPSGTLEEIIASNWVNKEYAKSLVALLDTVIQSAATHSMEIVIQNSVCEHIWCSLYLIPVIDNGQMDSVIGCLENINDQKHKIEHLTELSLKDGLTGVYNRYAIEDFIKASIEELCECTSKDLALLILDIDHFKNINDQNGHDYGDDLLIKLSQALAATLPQDAVLGRLGGDEFLIFTAFDKQAQSEDLDKLADSIVVGIKQRFADYYTPVTVSIGAAWYNKNCNTFKKLYHNADAALYETKKKGRNGYTIWGAQ